MKSWIDPELQARYGRFATSAAPWVAAGFNVIPSRGVGDKRPGTSFKELYRCDSPRIGGGDLKAWGDGRPDVPGLLLLSSGARLGLVVVDIDDPTRLDWTLRVFGETPLMVQTGRDEGGFHAYYRIAPGERVTGSANLIGPSGVDPYKTRIDVKSWGGYTVTPGSLHQSGLEYLASVPFPELTLGLLESLPEFDLDRHEAERQAGFDRRGKRPPCRVPGRGETPGEWSGAFAEAGVLEPSQIVIDERGNERELRELLDGERLFAPYREDQNPSATVFRRGPAHYVYDWSTSERWSVATDCAIDFDALLAPFMAAAEPEVEEDGSGCADRSPRCSLNQEDHDGVEGCVSDATEPAANDTDEEDLPDWPAYLDASPAPPETDDPLRLREYGLTARLDHVDLPAAISNIRSAVRAREAASPVDVTFIQSPPGTGKTLCMEDEWRDERVTTAVAIVPSISLAHAAAARLGGGAVSYQEEGAEEAPKLVTTIHSLARFQRDEIDLLAIDELSAVIDALCAPRSLVDQPVETLMSLLQLIRRAKRVVIGDADLQLWHVAFIASRLPPGKRVRLYTHAPKFKETVVISSTDFTYARMIDGLAAVEAARLRGEKHCIAIQADTKAATRQIYEVIRVLYPGLKSVCITGDNADEKEVQQMLADPDGMVRDNHVILHNTACATGVSFNVSVSGVYTFYENRDISPKSIMQMHMRFRKSLIRFIGTKPWKTENRPRYSQDIWRRHKRRHSAEAKLLKRRLKDAFTLDLDGGYRIDNPHYEQAFFACAGQEAEAFNDRSGEVLRLVRTRIESCEICEDAVTPDEANAIKAFFERRKHVAEVIHLDHCQGVSDAEKIAPKEAEVIQKKHVRTPEEKLALERHNIATFYEKDVTPELVDYDRNGKMRAALTKLARARMVLEHHDDELAFTEHERNKGRTLSRHRANFLEAQLLAALLREAFDIAPDQDWLNHLRELTVEAPELSDRVWAFLERHRGAIGAVDVFGKAPTEKAYAVRWLHGVLRRLGIKSARAKKGSGSDGAVWIHRYDVETACEMGQPCYLRMRSRFSSAMAARKWSEAVDALVKAAA